MYITADENSTDCNTDMDLKSMEDKLKKECQREQENDVTSTTSTHEDSDELSKLKNDIRRIVTQLVHMILENVLVPRNILLIGRPSSGKSSLINLLKSALLGKYHEIAKPGASTSGSTEQFTRVLRRYPNMGFTDAEVELFKSRIPEEIHIPKDFRLPTIFDMPGIEKDPTRLLRCILEGKVSADTEIVSSMNCYSQPSLNFVNAELRAIDRVVFVNSIAQDVNSQLLQDAYNLVFRTKNIGFICIYTHLDKKGIREETVKGRRKEIESILHLSKNSKLHTHDVINYCDDDDDVSKTEKHLYETNLKKHREALITLEKIFRQQEAPLNHNSVNEWSIVWWDIQKAASSIYQFIIQTYVYLSKQETFIWIAGAIIILIIAAFLFM